MTTVNKHAKIIEDHVFHSFPYNQFKPNFEGPHAEDCGGCIILAEVEKLVAELNRLSPVEDILAELEREKEKRAELTQDRWNAFEKAGVAKEGSITDLVESLVHERNSYLSLIDEIYRALTFIQNKIKESR